MPTSDDREEPAALVFGALADANRRQLLRHLAGHESATATELVRELHITRQAVVKHLAALERAGLVAGARQGRERRYRLTPQPLGEAAAWMARVGAEWDERLAALRRSFEQPRRPDLPR